ncbi:class I SAM-dependent methyltransferase [Microlunatus sp. GCM10028923]|uniref:class I SAM-dependent methyltransferase n=1 Tax=Microlunatus sp. GCM10028923 TaxID=3273400 RepID=UPI003609A441
MAEHRSRQDFEQVYADGRPPWELGGPQPALAELLSREPVEDPVLDAGCGTGDLALWLAARGHRVLAFDFSAAAIEQARAKITDDTLDVTFLVADATGLGDLPLRPRTVIDSGLLHGLDDASRTAYVTGLRDLCEPGAMLCLLARDDPGSQHADAGQDELITRFAAPDWVGTEVRPAEVHARVGGEELRLPANLMITRRAD